MNDIPHTVLGVIVAGIVAELVPGCLDIGDTGPLADGIQILEQVGAVRSVRAFGLVDGFCIEQVQICQTDDRPGKLITGEGVRGCEVTLDRVKFFGEITGHGTYLTAGLALGTAVSAFDVTDAFGLEIIVIGQLTNPFATIKAQIGIETGLAVEILFHGSITLFQIVRMVGRTGAEGLGVGVFPGTVVGNRKPVVGQELVHNFHGHADKTIAARGVGVVGHIRHGPLLEGGILAVSARILLGVAPDYFRIPVFGECFPKGDGLDQRVAHAVTLCHIGTVIEFDIRLLAYINGLFACGNGCRPTGKFLLGRLGGEELAALIVRQGGFFFIAIE